MGIAILLCVHGGFAAFVNDTLTVPLLGVPVLTRTVVCSDSSLVTFFFSDSLPHKSSVIQCSTLISKTFPIVVTRGDTIVGTKKFTRSESVSFLTRSTNEFVFNLTSFLDQPQMNLVPLTSYCRSMLCDSKVEQQYENLIEKGQGWDLTVAMTGTESYRWGKAIREPQRFVTVPLLAEVDLDDHSLIHHFVSPKMKAISYVVGFVIMLLLIGKLRRAKRDYTC